MTNSLFQSDLERPFEHLLPHVMIEAVRAQGFRPTGALRPFNSYENRVYEFPLEDEESIVVKFYRPGRWSLAALIDEHRFVHALSEHDVPVVCPLSLQEALPQIKTLAEISSLRDDATGARMFYAIYPKFRGREKDELVDDDREWLGRTIARMHQVGAHFDAPHRLELNPDTYGYDSLEPILNQEFLPAELCKSLETHLVRALSLLTPFFETDLEWIPLHGDCHLGNILWNREGLHLVDFDDCVIAPPVQDVWMLMAGQVPTRSPHVSENRTPLREDDAFLKGYSLFRPFELDTLILVEPLRTLRMIHHAAWIGKRYRDPAFSHAFPYYADRRYFETFLLSIKEQISLLQEL